MNTLTRLLAGFVTAAIAVLLIFFLTTVGLIIAALVGIALFVGALSVRGKGNNTQVGSFRVITFGSQPFASQGFEKEAFTEDSFKEMSKKHPQAQQKSLDDIVDLSPNDYKSVETPDDHTKKD